MELLINHPEVATRSCEDCKKWLYDLKTGDRVQRGGRDVLRPKISVLPCQTATGCPKGTPETAHEKELSDANKRALQFYYHSKAVGFRNLDERWANDPIIQRNFAAIEDELKKLERRELAAEINKGGM